MRVGFGWMSFGCFVAAASGLLHGRSAELVIHDLSGGVAWGVCWLSVVAWDAYQARRSAQ